jgi:DNA polymerase
MTQELKDNIRTILEFYKELGFERLPLEVRSQKSEVRSQKKISSTHHAVGSDKVSALKSLREEIGDCQRCKLSKGRTHIVFGEGNVNAQIMFIGEAPGKEEDLQGRPFVGDAGQILTSLINNMGKKSGLDFKRQDVYIANIVKCRPPMNRDPQEDEIPTCFPFLEKQIEIISPKVIMSLGKISAYTLLDMKIPMSKFSIAKIRGRFYEYRGIPVMPTFHPAYFLRNPKDKPLTWADAQAVLKKLQKGGEGKGKNKDEDRG